MPFNKIVYGTVIIGNLFCIGRLKVLLVYVAVIFLSCLHSLQQNNL